MLKILIVEDEEAISDLIRMHLTRAGYVCEQAFDGKEGADKICSKHYDLVLLDIMLPGKTGIGILKDMRAGGNTTPVILLTALGDVEDRVAGLDSGADDYLVKPFDFDELLARIRVLIRRGNGRASGEIKAGDLVMDTAGRTVTRGGREIELTAREFNILEYLLENRGRVLSRDKICNHIWNYDYDGASNVIDVYMHHLRKKIDENQDEKLIKTVKGAGYVIR